MSFLTTLGVLIEVKASCASHGHPTTVVGNSGNNMPLSVFRTGVEVHLGLSLVYCHLHMWQVWFCFGCRLTFSNITKENEDYIGKNCKTVCLYMSIGTLKGQQERRLTKQENVSTEWRRTQLQLVLLEQTWKLLYVIILLDNIWLSLQHVATCLGRSRTWMFWHGSYTSLEDPWQL